MVALSWVVCSNIVLSMPVRLVIQGASSGAHSADQVVDPTPAKCSHCTERGQHMLGCLSGRQTVVWSIAQLSGNGTAMQPEQSQSETLQKWLKRNLINLKPFSGSWGGGQDRQVEEADLADPSSKATQSQTKLWPNRVTLNALSPIEIFQNHFKLVSNQSY